MSGARRWLLVPLHEPVVEPTHDVPTLVPVGFVSGECFDDLPVDRHVNSTIAVAVVVVDELGQSHFIQFVSQQRVERVISHRAARNTKLVQSRLKFLRLLLPALLKSIGPSLYNWVCHVVVSVDDTHSLPPRVPIVKRFLLNPTIPAAAT